MILSKSKVDCLCRWVRGPYGGKVLRLWKKKLAKSTKLTDDDTNLPELLLSTTSGAAELLLAATKLIRGETDMNAKKLAIFGASVVVLGGVLVYALGIFPPASSRDGRGAIGQRSVYRAEQPADVNVNPGDAPVAATAEQLKNEQVVTLQNGQMFQLSNGMMYQIQNGQMVALQNGMMFQLSNGQMAKLENGVVYQLNSGQMQRLNLNSGQMLAVTNGQILALQNGVKFQMNNGQMQQLNMNSNQLSNGQLQLNMNSNQMQNAK
jgi:hypothetical protein